MPKNFRSQILWSAAFAASAVLTYLFGVMLYVHIAGLFGPVSPESAELAASISSVFRTAARPSVATALKPASIPAAETTAYQTTRADTETTAQATSLPPVPPAPALLPAIAVPETKEPKPAETKNPLVSNAAMAANIPSAVPAPEAKKTAQTAPKNMRRVLLYIRNPQARKVAVTGSFSGWKPKQLAQKHNRWETELALPPGKYEYSFVIDGVTQSDPLQPLRGAKGSVLIVN